MAARVVINDQSVAQYMATNPVMQAALRTVATSIETKAVENTPIGASITFGPFWKNTPKGRILTWSHRHGYYRKLWDVAPYRGGWRVWNRGAYAHLLEWGSVNNPPYAPLRRAVRQSGLRYRPNPNSRGA